MRSLVYADWASYAIAFLVPTLHAEGIRKEYLDRHGIPTDDVQIIALHYTRKKTSKTEQKQFIEEELVPYLKESEANYLVVCDAEYFKTLTGQVKAEPNLGYVRDCLFGPWKVIYAPSHKSIFYDPDSTRAKIKQAMEALLAHARGEYADPGTGIIAFEEYPDTVGKIEYWLKRLLQMNKPLSIDIETFDLKHHKAGIGTISFAWSKHEGIAFAVDYQSIEGATEAPYGRQVRNEPVRQLLRDFFAAYTQRALYYNISFDVYVLVYQLYMNDLLDTEGMLQGMEILLRNWDCGKLITYLATNSCAKNKLSLKDQGQKFAGNYAQTEIEDITKIPLEILRRYNLVDALTAWYVRDKHWPTLIKDRQQEIYQTLFQPGIWDIIQMQLTGLPLNLERVKWVQTVLERIRQDAKDALAQTQVIQEFTYRLNEKWVEEKNAKLKKKRVTLADAKEEFNPNSGPQLQELLYEMLGLPVLDLTDSKQPATGSKTLTKLIHHTQNPDVLAFLQAMLDFKAVDKLLSAFIPAFLDAAEGPDGWHYLFGNFNLGGTRSGRLSSNNPNLQNLPANVEMLVSAALLQLFPELAPFVKKGKLNLGKLIKSCFEAPPGWVFCGLDFASLEDRISALTTKDPNKLKVYVGHTVYELDIDGVVHHIRDDATVIYDGREYTGEQFYNLMVNTN